MSLIFAYLFYFIAASASPLQRRWLSINKVDDGHIAFAFKVSLIVAVLGSTLILFDLPEFSGNPILILLLSLLCGVFGSLYFVLQYKAQRHVEAGITTLVSNIYTPVTIILASVFLAERLKPIQILGTVTLLCAVIIVTKKHQIKRFRFDKFLLMMIFSGIALGILLTAERGLIKTTGFTTGVLLSWWTQCLGLGITMFLTKSKTTLTVKDINITGFLRFAQSLSWVILIAVVANLSLVAAVTTFKVVVIFIAAAFLLKERDDLSRKLFGSFVAVIGLLLMR